MDIKELKELISLLEDSKLSELEIEEEGRRIRLTKQSETYMTMPAPVQMQAPMAAPAPSVAPSTPSDRSTTPRSRPWPTRDWWP